MSVSVQSVSTDEKRIADMADRIIEVLQAEYQETGLDSGTFAKWLCTEKTSLGAKRLSPARLCIIRQIKRLAWDAGEQKALNEALYKKLLPLGAVLDTDFVPALRA